MNKILGLDQDQYAKIVLEINEEFSSFGDMLRISRENEKHQHLISDYYNHRDIDGLAKEIRSNPDIFQSHAIREFIAGIVEGKIKPPTKGFTEKETLEKHKSYAKTISHLNGMGIPIRDTTTEKLSCCSVVSIFHKESEDTIYKGWLKLGKPLDYYKWMDGRLFYIINNRSAPESIKDLQRLSKKIKTISEIEIKQYDNEIANDLTNHLKN